MSCQDAASSSSHTSDWSLAIVLQWFWLVACMVACIHRLTISVQLSLVAMQATGHLPFTSMLLAGRLHGRLCIFSIMV